ncbi:hypothetical protein [Algoriphagus boritolerans]|uniref:hypothetical protein n=1 Tax=Algoriphagus boritolerans TaxID=308111 RepID=UPI000AA0FA9D
MVEFEAKDVKKDEWSEAFGLTDEEIEEAKGAFTFTVKNINRTEAAELNQEFF